jgi:hypothetical protein
VRAHLRPANVGLLSAAALLGGPSEATQDTSEADSEADEALAREMEAQRQREKEQRVRERGW